MPIFEFRCSACGHLEEVLQKHTDPAPDACPRCGAEKKMGRELSVSAFHLKGGGWYKDLYASSSTTTDSTSEGSNPADTSSKSSDAKTETKSESKAETPAAAAAPAPPSSPAPAAPTAPKPAAA